MTETNKKKRSKKKFVIVLTVLIILFLVVVSFSFTYFFYSSNFIREQTTEPMIRTVDEFPGLIVKEFSFSSNKGQKLMGYKYSKKNLDPIGIVVIAHGLGIGGQCIYMDAADFFTSNGYLVFSYDATGNDKSEGDSINGTEQGVIDLSYAIDYIERDPEMQKYPIVLFGHSWGAYCVSTVLNVHPEIKAVVALSGFNSSSDLILFPGKGILQQYIKLIEKTKFGKYADYTAMSGFENSHAGVMVVQSKDDQDVPEETGYDLYYSKYKNDSRFRFILYDNRQHMYIYYTDSARKYIADYNVRQAEFVSQTGKKMTQKLLDKYIKANFDKKKAYEIDRKLFGEILDFYNGYCK